MATVNQTTLDKLLNLAASWQVFNMKVHQYHYNISSSNFRSLHALFKELYEDADEHYDEVAERLRQIGQKVVLSCADLARRSVVSDDNSAATPEAMLQGVVDAFTAITTLQTEIWFESDEQRDMVTNDLMVQLNKYVDLKNWMVTAQMGKEVAQTK